MNKPKGGRGYKAPYETVVMRVPKPLEEQIEKQVEDYRKQVIEGVESKEPENLPSLDSAVLKAKEILKQKKGARDSVEKLLQVLYGTKISLKD
jgi:hypothetical protein